MADITRCTEPGCPACGSVITFDDSSSHEHVTLLESLVALGRAGLSLPLARTAESIPACYSDDTPLRYVNPTTD